MRALVTEYANRWHKTRKEGIDSITPLNSGPLNAPLASAPPMNVPPANITGTISQKEENDLEETIRLSLQKLKQPEIPGNINTAVNENTTGRPKTNRNMADINNIAAIQRTIPQEQIPKAIVRKNQVSGSQLIVEEDDPIEYQLFSNTRFISTCVQVARKNRKK
jgi:hypothetical protein